ncbi:hypothetical protein LTR36_001056 [Oleoguttula mirabilis]|uniref:Glutamine amidotransferase type-2 domain-containing protein n=1 Tax=Oleoguttula mirabilis TaxID=1507867 RepID=A0AAV9JQZ5_9PEZI|nr:hypothetical protein LTR36_001056 [Oleoguttula mirabilis]
MCGIFCAVSCPTPVWPSPEIQQLLEKRGPDSSDRRIFTVTRDTRETRDQPQLDTRITFVSTVLSLRGQATVQQPYQVSTSSSTLCWNGEAWAVKGVAPEGNDTAAVFRLLDDAEAAQTPLEGTRRLDQTSQRAASIARQIAQIAGPYAFVFHDAAHGLLFYGRDFLGRRSLLTKLTEQGDILIASVTDAPVIDGWSEVEADGLYCVDLLQVLDRAGDGGRETPYSRHPVTKVSYHSAEDARHAPLAAVDLPAASSSIACVPKLAILFSGGLDCSVLARLAHDLIPLPEGIDLLNVAFENPRIHKHVAEGANSQATYELCPDRATGRTSYAELQRICPGREWRFVAINIPYTETMEHRQKVITLMHPHNTEMDLSISYALYFAARGAGSLSPLPSVLEPYTTSARVLLSGLGADELFGGYQRHATAYGRKGFSGLLDELDLDISRLGKRNLGRDDRVISNWGREARFPYLDEQLLTWALDAPVTDKCGFGEPAFDCSGGPGDGSEMIEPGKKVLRCLAWKLGMREAAKEKKRAIQFGARTAKMETGKTKGTQLLS